MGGWGRGSNRRMEETADEILVQSAVMRDYCWGKNVVVVVVVVVVIIVVLLLQSTRLVELRSAIKKSGRCSPPLPF